jgi:hypothetical protein
LAALITADRPQHPRSASTQTKECAMNFMIVGKHDARTKAQMA